VQLTEIVVVELINEPKYVPKLRGFAEMLDPGLAFAVTLNGPVTVVKSPVTEAMIVSVRINSRPPFVNLWRLLTDRHYQSWEKWALLMSKSQDEKT
jgi:hypothetical protein